MTIAAGVLLFSGGMYLTGYNMYHDNQAGIESYRAAEKLALVLPLEELYVAAIPETEEEILVEDSRTLPVKTIDGLCTAHISGVLSIH